MDYLDFELRISKGEGGRYPVRARSRVGEATGTLLLDTESTELTRVLTALEKTRGGERGIKFPDREESRDLAVVEEFGRRLFGALMDGDVGTLYENSKQEAREARGQAGLAALRPGAGIDVKGMRLRLSVDAPDLTVLPWEMLFDPDLDDFVCLRADIPLVRHPDSSETVVALTTEPPLRVLAMIGDHTDLDVDRERELMEIAVEHLVARGDLELTWLEGHTLRALETKLGQGDWHVFHFIGHGRFDEELDEGVLLMEPDRGTRRRDTPDLSDDGRKRGPHRVSASALSSLFPDHVEQRPTRLVVLNACEGARGSGDDLFSSIGAKLARKIPAVVAMQYAISDSAAIEFSRRFYETLVKGLPVDLAVTEARKAIRIYLSDTAEWATPVLHMRSPDGRLFSVDYAGAIHGMREVEEDLVSIPVRREDLMVLLEKVREAWIEGVLEESVWDFARTDLGLADMPGAVANTWRGIVETLDGEQELQDEGLLKLFDDHGGSLLVLGEPGSGKTTRILQLTRDLLDRAATEPGWPVPVVFQLAGWNRPELGFAEWLAGQLAEKYQIPKRLGRRWIKGGHLVPMLDGLDEVRGEMRTECVDAINTLSRRGGLTSMVVSTRVKEYLELPNRLRLKGALRLQPIGRDQVVSQVRAVGPPLAALADLLEKGDSGLLIEAQQPAMLSLMVPAYWNLPPERLKIEGTPSATARRRHIMEAFVLKMFSRYGPEASRA